jgi:hypothetical protein
MNPRASLLFKDTGVPMKKTFSARATAWRAVAAVCLMLGIWSCDLSETKEGRNFISLTVPDSLKDYDSIRIVLVRPGTADTLDTLWHGAPLTSQTQLEKLPTRRYVGGEVDVIIVGIESEEVVYRMRVEYRGPDTRPVKVDLPLPDKVKPVLSLVGKDTLEWYEGAAYQDPGAVCSDDRDSLPVVSVEGAVDTRSRGWHSLSYRCTDNARNAAREIFRWIRVVRVPDTIPPVLTLRGPDSLDIFQGPAYPDSGATCLDDRDGPLAVTVTGSVDVLARGAYTLSFACSDSAGNEAVNRTRTVHVLRPPDPDKPILTLRGPDTAFVHEQAAYSDSGAGCLDARDGVLPVTVTGKVDTGLRGMQSLAFHCADSAGNAADAFRRIFVTRRPDAVKPILTLRGMDSAVVYDHQAYVDSGAACLDDRDGSRPVSVQGTVDTGARGWYELSFHCADSSGNAAEAKRQVRVTRKPDAVKPEITLRGPDSLQVYQGAAYADAGADCADDRDGALSVTVIGSINTSLRTLQALAYLCADSAGNAAVTRTRKVNVARAPDNVKPVVTLRGERNIRSLLGAAYTDAGADCLDDRDGILPVTVQGSVDVAKPGTYILTFNCADSAGNPVSPAPTRSVVVTANIDSVPPVITRIGPDTLVAVSSDAVFDPWATCTDAVDGPVAVLRTALPAVGFTGHYQVTYSCQDAALNEATVSRIVKIGLFGTYLPAIAEGQMDTLEDRYNTGGSGTSGIVKEPNGKYFTLTRFDLSKVVKPGLKSAKLRFFTFGHGAPWPGTQSDGKGGFGTFANYTFRVYTVKSEWTEGTGNWFYHDGGFRNGGATWYQHYPMSAAVMAASTNPSDPTGITGADRSLVRASNIDLVSTKTANLFYGNWNGNPEQVPPPRKLTVLEVDVTDYVKGADPAKHYGFLVKVDGTLPSHYIGITTKELGDGSYAPRLMLEY